eukprot:gnl/MRDRNA2_/MRDRNA2_68476_c0_seq1.p1 gnl/MRDRNA2_/MRDRNA2_68476_c0~~gnl/MRDRNA2_/MRDRNA2_68476_c0_seq1.p1  ORF type:complete len:561 (+),score=97.52 gnl/MRDRNA2_/MRDRNA2_68476_c0_seq1:44-1726(+)
MVQKRPKWRYTVVCLVTVSIFLAACAYSYYDKVLPWKSYSQTIIDDSNLVDEALRQVSTSAPIIAEVQESVQQTLQRQHFLPPVQQQQLQEQPLAPPPLDIHKGLNVGDATVDTYSPPEVEQQMHTPLPEPSAVSIETHDDSNLKQEVAQQKVEEGNQLFRIKRPLEKEDPESVAACSIDKAHQADGRIRQWVQDKAAVLKSKKCGPRVVVADPNFCTPGAGLGNCILGIVSAFALAVIVDAVPLMGGDLSRTLLSGMTWTNGTWTTGAAKCQPKGPVWANGQMPKGSGTMPGLDVLMGKDLKGSFKTGTTILSPQYVAAAMFTNPNAVQRACEFFPGIFHGKRDSFGFFNKVFHSFFRIPTTQGVDDVVKRGWRVQGPLMALHVRRAYRTIPYFLDCLEQRLHHLRLDSVRIFIATTWQEVADAFERTFGIRDGFLVHSNGSREMYPPRKYEIRFTAALNEKGSKTGKWKDRKSPSALTDFHILSKAQILVGEPRSTFADGAAAIGNPYLYYLVHEGGCDEVLFREPCMHNLKHLYKSKNMRPRIREYFEYCDKKGAGM